MPEKRKVLAVDDDPFIRKFLRAKLEQEGYESGCFRDGYAAMAGMKKASESGEPYGLVVCHVNCRGRNELIGYIRETHPTVPIIAITAGTIGGDINSAESNMWAKLVLTKPQGVINELGNALNKYYPKE